MKEEKKKIPLQSVKDLAEANEWMFNRQKNGEIDAKSADAMNTTLKGQKSLIVDVPLQLFKIAVTASIKKVQIDPQIFSRFGLPVPLVPQLPE